MPTFKIKVLHLAGKKRAGKTSFAVVQVDNTALPYSSLAVTSDAFNTRPTPIDDINGKGYKMELKSSRKYSTNHTKSKSCH